MKLSRTLAAAALAACTSLGLAMPAHAAAPGGLGDGDNNGLADVWVTIDDHKYSSAVDRNGVTEYYYKVPTQDYLKLGWAKDIGLGSASTMAALPDVTGDGRADAMVRFGEHLYLYRGTGGGNMVRGPEIGHGWGAMDTIVYAGQLNGDSGRYLLARSSANKGLYAYKFTGSGSVSTVGQVGYNWGGMKHILSPGQMVGDAKTDLIGIDGAGNMFCYRGTGMGKVSSVGQCGRGWKGFMSVFIPGDMNGDGRWDLVGVKELTNPTAFNEPTGGMRAPVSERSPMYLYTNNGNANWGSARLIGHDFFQFRLFA